ncbi:MULTISPECIES: glycosidase [Dictyoglomus]|jgi:predicted GH43/DUF377 family glycosyl hydrolase|uniref:Glycosidase PH1107-related n=1 Tax=Dictyoglomus turgidum (strain DSM 6724 / Z-1310) TaxID=515635 RepID=B8DZL0_DICTD|nr:MULTISPECIES: glycosidase [Dictyoglomus]ACK41943.1 glycosidase PH1107-related [Dictyoglomus turgidum DSM 6724]PNV79232.1 MAG: glycosidase [Dictyoglomus turgidum]HBU31497.1 glycosidase [Dictyoglomus sp.]
MVFTKGDVINVIGFNDFLTPVINYWEEEGYRVEISYDYRIRNKDYKLYLVIDTPKAQVPWRILLEELKEVKGKVLFLNYPRAYKMPDHPLWKHQWDGIIAFFWEEYLPKNIYLVNFPSYPVVEKQVTVSREKFRIPENKKAILVIADYSFENILLQLSELKRKQDFYFMVFVSTAEREVLVKRFIEKQGIDVNSITLGGVWYDELQLISAVDLVIIDGGKDVEPFHVYKLIGCRTPVIVKDKIFTNFLYNEVIKFDGKEKTEIKGITRTELSTGVMKFRNKEELFYKIDLIFTNDYFRNLILGTSRAFAYAHSPERVGSQFIFIFRDVLNPPLYISSKKAIRYMNNPLFKARPKVYINVGRKKVAWEKLVYNAGAIRIKGTTYVLYRALGEDGVSRIGLWWSRDGYTQEGRLDYPIFGPKESYEMPKNPEQRRRFHKRTFGMIREVGGTEDPRLSLIDNNLYMTYTAYGDVVQLALAKIPVEVFLKGVKSFRSYEEWNNAWIRNGPIFKYLEDKDAVLYLVDERQEEYSNGKRVEDDFVNIFPELLEKKIALIHRIPPDMQILYTDELKRKSIKVGRTFLMPTPKFWDSIKIGAGAPPLKTKYGWLHIYHGVGDWMGKKAYGLGVVLTPLDDPEKIIYRSAEPILQPEEIYEVEGWVPNVVFTCGVVPKNKDSTETLDLNDEILIYYGGADEVMALAEIKVGDLLPEDIIAKTY